MTRKQRLLAYVATGLGFGVLVAGIAIYSISRSEFGMERVRRLAVKWLDDRVQGTVFVGELGGRGLLGGLTLRGFHIIDERGRPFLRADSARLAYNWRTLLAGEIVISRATLFNPEIHFEQLPGDSIWNFQHVFPARGKPGAPARRRLILINDMRIINGTGVVRVPYETPQAVADAIAEAIEDPRREVIDTVPGGLAKVLRFDSVYSHMPRVLWESPVEHGKLIDVRSLRGRGFIWRDPMHVTGLRGTITMRDTIIAFDMPDARFPSSQASLVGRVIMEEGQNFFDIRADSRSFAFRDMKWLHPRLPENGGGSGVLRIQSQRPRGILWLATDMRIAAPGTRVAGSFGVVTGGDSLYFTNVDLRASPLNLQLIEDILPNTLPVDGLLVGTVEVKGGLSALRTRGDVQLSNSLGQSGVKWRGTIDLRRGIGADNFRADMQRLDLAMLTALRPELNLRGHVTGHFEADGNVDRSMTFAADIHHYLSGYSSSFAGGGTYTGGDRGLEMEINATPLSLQDLAQTYPALERLRGEARGPIRVTGTLDSLNINANLETAGGRAEINGRLTRSGEAPRYAGTATLFSFRLDRLIAGLPDTELDGVVRFDMAGSSTEDMSGRIGANLTGGRVKSFDFLNGYTALTLAGGTATVDTLAARTLLGDLSARGTLSLAADQVGQLDFQLFSDSIAPVIADSLKPATTAGRVRGQGQLTGALGAFDLRANVAVTLFRYAGVSGERATFAVTGTGLGRDDARLEVRGRADSIVAYRERADTAAFLVTYANGHGDARIDAGAANGDAWKLDAGYEQRESGMTLTLRDLQVGNQSSPWRLTHVTSILTDDHGVSTDSIEVRRADRGRVRASGRIAWHDASHEPEPGQTSDFRLDFDGVPFAEFALLTGGPKDNVRGTFKGHVRLAGDAIEPVLDGEAQIEGFAVGGATLDYLGGSFTYANKLINARIDADKDGSRVFFADGRIPIDLAFAPVRERKLAEPLRFAIRADSMPLSFMTSMLDGFTDVRGRLSGTLLAGGTTLDPQLSGSLALHGGVAYWDVTGVRYHDVEGDVRLGAESVARVDANLRANGGSARVSGNIDFGRLTDPGFDLQLAANNFLAAKRRDAEVTTSGDVQLRGRYRRPELTGSVVVERGALFLDELYRRYQVIELDNPLLYDVVDTALVSLGTILRTQNPFVKNLIVRDLRVEAGRETWLRSRDLNVEVAGALTVAFLLGDTAAAARSADDLRLTGTMRAIRGTYQLYYPGIVRNFTIRDGTVDFPGTPGVDPNLRFNTVYRAPRSAGQEPIDIIAIVSGTMRNPHVRLTSDEEPPISESDLASYLFFGVPTYVLTANQNAAVSQSLVRSGGFGYLTSGLQTFAQSFGLLDYVSLTAAESQSPGISTQAGIASLFADTRLELGRYVGSDAQIYIAYSQRLTSSGYLNPGVRIEWRFLPTLTAEVFAEDRFARGAPTFGLENTAVFRKVYGLQLFREWSY